MRLPGKLPRLTRLPLGVEITLLLIVKLALIVALAKTFFAHPQAKHMRMPTASVEQRMLSTTPTISTTTTEATNPTGVSNGSDR
jgi:hypothetical protein